MALSPSSISGFRLAGGEPSSPSSDLFQSHLAGMPGQMTPGYTGAFDPTTISGLDPKEAGLYKFLDVMDQRAYDRELKAAQMMKQQRKEEAQEAAKIKMWTSLPGQIMQGFESIARLSYPAAAIQIQSQTPGLLANVYANSPYSNRKWLS